MVEPAPSRRPPLATWLIPIVALGLLGLFLMLGKAPVTPASPPRLRTPEGKPIPVEPGTPSEAGQSTDPTPSTPQPAPMPLAPVYAGAILVTDTPYWQYTVQAPFEAVRDYYIGHFGAKVQYAESVIPSTGLKRAIVFVSGDPEAVQISETEDTGVVELAIGPLHLLRGH